MSVSPRARGASAADGLGNGKMQLIKDSDVSVPLRKEMATKQKELQGWKVGRQSSQAANHNHEKRSSPGEFNGK